MCEEGAGVNVLIKERKEVMKLESGVREEVKKLLSSGKEETRPEGTINKWMLVYSAIRRCLSSLESLGILVKKVTPPSAGRSCRLLSLDEHAVL